MSKLKIFVFYTLLSFICNFVFLDNALFARAADTDQDCGRALNLSIQTDSSTLSRKGATKTVKVTLNANSPCVSEGKKVEIVLVVKSKKGKFFKKWVETTDDTGTVSIDYDWDGNNSKDEPFPDGQYWLLAKAKEIGKRGSDEPKHSSKSPWVKKYLVINSKGPKVPGFTLSRAAVGAGQEVVKNKSEISGFPYKFYYGVNHSHTIYSDGGRPTANSAGFGIPSTGAKPVHAYKYAKEQGKLNFLAINEHNHWLDKNYSGASNSTLKSHYKDGFTAAKNATEPNRFVGVYGMEWGKYDPGHLNIYNQPMLFNDKSPNDVYVASNDYLGVYKQVAENQAAEGTTVCFNHPNSSHFKGFKKPKSNSEFVTGIAILNGPSHKPIDDLNGKAGRPYTFQFHKALSIGWKVAPEAHQDNHFVNYGTSTPNRTVVLIPESSEYNLDSHMDALKNRRFYASQDRNVQLMFTAGEDQKIMGSSFDSSLPVPLSIELVDPSGENTQLIEVIAGKVTGRGTPKVETVLENFNSNELSASLTPKSSGEEWFYYVHAIQKDGNEVWSAPIWVKWD